MFKKVLEIRLKKILYFCILLKSFCLRSYIVHSTYIYIFQQKYHTICHSFNGCNQIVLEC